METADPPPRFDPARDGMDRPIGDYAIVGDCRTAALISRDGSLDWLCWPHYAGPTLFAALLDRKKGGRFAIRPTRTCELERRYVKDTAVLETEFITDSGRVRVTDLMPVCTAEESRRQLLPQRELLRIIEGLEGSVEMEVVFEPRPNFGQRRVKLTQWGKLGWYHQDRNGLVGFHSEFPLSCSPDHTLMQGRSGVKAGERFALSLTFTRHDIAIIPPLADAATGRMETTIAWWRRWCSSSSYQGPHRDAVARSVLTLKLLSFTLSGAMVAAPTTSLPEEIGGYRNWDYRYCWLRDASLIFRALVATGYLREADAFLGWLLHTTRLTRPELRVMYDVYGLTQLKERELPFLRGYAGSRPVRIGNGAAGQLQLDVYGELLLAAYEYVQVGGRLSRDERGALTDFGRVVARRWREPDHGIWEVRGPPTHHTHSKMMCWVTLDRLIKLAEQGHLKIRLARYRREREAIRQAIESEGFSRRLNSYVDVFGAERMDASLLRMASHGYMDPKAPAMTGTYERVQAELGVNGFLYRYRPGTDHLPGGEGAFAACSFWAVDYLAHAGRLDEAQVLFERLLGCANDVGLYGEEFDVETGAPLGNFPQAFTHVGLVTAATSLAQRSQ